MFGIICQGYVETFLPVLSAASAHGAAETLGRLESMSPGCQALGLIEIRVIKFSSKACML